jgi:di/tricarboxylate transporter
VTLLFAATEANGTLARVAGRAVRLARGDARLVPWLLFAIAFGVSAVGPGAVPSVALVAPLAAAVATQLRLSPFLGALFVANGANAGNLSPLSAVGIIANSRMAEAGLAGHEGKVFAANALAHVLVTVAAYAIWRWRRPATTVAAAAAAPPPEPLDARQRLSFAVVTAWALGAVILRLPVGLSALAAVVVLLVCRAASESATLRVVPWGAVLMVSGMSTLVSLVEKTGGMELFSGLLARLATPATVNGAMAFVTGLISTWSSTSGVVLPAFLPTVPGLLARLGGGDPLALSLSINVGSSLVDVSPLSTLGALCVAAVEDPATAQSLFRRLLAWGLSMTLVGALLSQLFAGPLARL